MNKRGATFLVLRWLGYIVLAVMVFLALFNLVSNIATGKALARNALVEDSSLLFESLALVDNTVGREVNVKYAVPDEFKFTVEENKIKTQYASSEHNLGKNPGFSFDEEGIYFIIKSEKKG